jgi:S-adenosylhomocysteine hydrolase
MAVSRRGVERMLTNKLEMTLDDRDHQVFLLVIEGRVIARTKLSRGSEKYKTLGDDLVRKMAQQLRVSMPVFRELESCTKSRDDYLQVLREHGFL